jgi:hypothetical protein
VQEMQNAKWKASANGGEIDPLAQCGENKKTP